MIQCWFIDVWCWQWRYCIRLENLGDLTVQLRERHWRIFSLSGTLETVRGRGVVGQEPVLSSSLPAFQYSSHVSLQAPSGHMWWDIYIFWTYLCFIEYVYSLVLQVMVTGSVFYAKCKWLLPSVSDIMLLRDSAIICKLHMFYYIYDWGKLGKIMISFPRAGNLM